jgi:hypothetical protein
MGVFMARIVFILLFLFSFLEIFGQAGHYGLRLVGFTKSNCQKESKNDGKQIIDNINSIVITDTSLTIDFNFYSHCCYEFLCDISVDSTKTLNLIYTAYGTPCKCFCCFGLTYHLQVKKKKNTPEIKAVMINGDRNTIKPINW